jgi:hypothetical protein
MATHTIIITSFDHFLSPHHSYDYRSDMHNQLSVDRPKLVIPSSWSQLVSLGIDGLWQPLFDLMQPLSLKSLTSLTWQHLNQHMEVCTSVDKTMNSDIIPHMLPLLLHSTTLIPLPHLQKLQLLGLHNNHLIEALSLSSLPSMLTELHVGCIQPTPSLLSCNRLTSFGITLADVYNNYLTQIIDGIVQLLTHVPINELFLDGTSNRKDIQSLLNGYLQATHVRSLQIVHLEHLLITNFPQEWCRPLPHHDFQLFIDRLTANEHHPII